MTRRLALVALALLSSCAFASGTMLHNHCTTDADCHGATCDLRTSMCVGTPPSPLTVGLEIAVPATGASGGAVFPVQPFAVNGPDTSHDIAAPRPITVAGTVRQVGRDGAISADVVFTPDETIPGRPGVVVRVSTTAMPMAIDPVAVADYVAQLTGHTHYTVRIEPTGTARAELPPIEPRAVDMAGHALVDTAVMDAPALEADFAYPAMLDTLDGDLVNAAGDPLSGLTVQAVDAVTGDVVSSSPTSAPATDMRPGSFTLTFAPGVTHWKLRVSAATPAVGTTMPVPTFTVDPTRIYPSGSRARILVPDTMPVMYSAMVARADTGDPVQGATVLLSADAIYDPATGVTGSFSAAPTTTDATGMFQAVLVPGTYQLVIVPGSGSDDLAVTLVDNISLHATTMPIRGALFEVPTRATLGGTVSTSDGHEMPGATVQATSLGMGACPAAAYARSPTATTDPTGQFTTRVDCARFDVVAQPPTGTGYAWTAIPNVDVGPSGLFDADVTLVAPVPLGGMLLDATGAPIAGAEIRAFGVIETPEPGARRSIAIGRVTTDAGGHYSLLLPPSL